MARPHYPQRLPSSDTAAFKEFISPASILIDRNLSDFLKNVFLISSKTHLAVAVSALSVHLSPPSPVFPHPFLLALTVSDLSATMTIKGWASGAGGPAVSLLASPLHRSELAGLEPLTSCAFRQLMLQMELCSGPTPELNN